MRRGRQASAANGIFVGCALICAAAPARADQAEPTVEDLRNLSIDDLANVNVTSVSKTPQPLGEAPASIYVISRNDILRAGARTIPEMLRLAPNLFVARINPSDYVITARGLSTSFEAQNFSNKLLVLIDGRSVYNPLFSGMYWDMQDVLPENIERIEVISGPGATLWGANAVNGVINIITRKSSESEGATFSAGAGNLREAASFQYGGKLGEEANYRAYVKSFYEHSFENPLGFSADDGWSKSQAGFRVDWAPAGELFTFQGDIHRGREDRVPDLRISGANLQATWRHALADGAAFQLMAYYDTIARKPVGNNGNFTLDTYNIEFQHSFKWGGWNEIVWGANQRLTTYDITPQLGATSLLFVPGEDELSLTSFFIQDQMALADDFDLILGLKLERDPFSNFEPMPSIRATWRPDDTTMVWGAVSRAVRSPTPFDVDVIERLGAVDFLIGNKDFDSEKLIAYELGLRAQLSERASFSVTLFDHEYDDLRTIELSPLGGLPLEWGNLMEGRIYGVEAWGTYQVADWWRLKAGLTLQDQDLNFKPGASGILGLPQAGNDPEHQAFLNSSMDLADDLTLEANLRWIGSLPAPAVDSYVQLNARIAWAVTEELELSLTGTDLLADDHREFTAPPADDIPRGVFFETRWKL
jgi:iron complex outermembrane recepter protein